MKLFQNSVKTIVTLLTSGATASGSVLCTMQMLSQRELVLISALMKQHLLTWDSDQKMEAACCRDSVTSQSRRVCKSLSLQMLRESGLTSADTSSTKVEWGNAGSSEAKTMWSLPNPFIYNGADKNTDPNSNNLFQPKLVLQWRHDHGLRCGRGLWLDNDPSTWSVAKGCTIQTLAHGSNSKPDESGACCKMRISGDGHQEERGVNDNTSRVSVQSTLTCNFAWVNALNSVSPCAQTKERGRGPHKRKWGIEMTRQAQ